ncbi:MAG: adenosylmethionine decarboxylase [Bacilli bacterium]
MMKPLGVHILADAYECDYDLLNDEKGIEKMMIEAAKAAGATIISTCFHKFNPQGVSGVVVIAESHLSIHTWPELNCATIDVFTCGENVDTEKACQLVCKGLNAGNVKIEKLVRGDMK